jgi:EAL and modified HD-GYP domain-containing signal transduction protein
VDVFVARQPIFDRACHLYAYELLFRSGNGRNEFDGTEGASATMQLMANSLLSIGLDNILCGKKAFLNFERTLLLGGLHSILPRETTVLEILESVEPDDEVVATCVDLHKQGYSLALDDFVDHQRFEPLTRLANVIKVDMRATAREEQKRLLRTYQPRGVAMVAEKVESHEEFEWARQAGYNFFQGYFFARPALVRGKQIPAYKLTCARLLSETQHAEIDFKRLTALIREDVSLTYKLLRYVNSALFGCYTEIRSIGQALAILGEAKIHHWAALAALPAMAQDKPGELITHSLVRARFCERISQTAGLPDCKLGFLMGLLSLLDGLIDLPLTEALDQVSVAPDIRGALLGTAGKSNVLAQVYELACAYEAGDWDGTVALASKLRIQLPVIGQAYAESTLWAHQALHATSLPGKDARRSIRHALNGTISIGWEDATGRERTCAAKLLNVSIAGLQLQVSEKIPIHARVSCDEPKLGIRGKGSVRYCSAHKGKYVIGLEFPEGTGWREPA